MTKASFGFGKGVRVSKKCTAKMIVNNVIIFDQGKNRKEEKVKVAT